MVHIQKVRDGIVRFTEQEICTQITGWKKIVVATGAGLLVTNLEQAAKKLPLGLADGDAIDVEAIYKEAVKHFGPVPVPVEIPFVGTMEVTKENLDTLYNMIMGA